MSELKQFDEFMDALPHCDTVKVILTGCGESVFETKQIYEGICALANRRAQPANEPLTLDELRQMDGKPVWLEDLLIPKCSGWNFTQKSGGTTLLVEPRFYPTSDGMVPHYDTDDITGNYGKTWLAYDHKQGGEQE